MAGGIMFPDLIGTIAKVESIDNSQRQGAWLDEDRAAKKSVAPYVQKALQGDQAALGEIATRHPDTFMKIAPLLERMDAGKRAKVKEDADFITQNGMAILNAPPEQQPQLYARVRREAEASGRNVSQWPTTYDPGWVKFNVDKAMPFAEHFKRSGEGVTFAPPAGGGGAGGDPAKAIGGIESGGRYDAVGPVANDKGQRAYGKYQVMDFNVGPWTAEILGKAMTPQEFLANPQAQDAVFNAKFGQYVKQHGSPEAAARAWFAGPGGMNNPNAKDVLGTTVAGYEKKFTAGMGGPSGAPPGMAVGADMPPADASGTPLPPAQQALQPLRGLQIPQGARVALQGGVPIVKDGNVLYLDANGGWGAAPLPSRANPQAAPAGYEPNPEGGGLRPIPGGPADPARQRTERVPPGYRLAADGQSLEFIPGGPADPSIAKKAAPMTDGQANAALYADRMRAAEQIIVENEAAGLNLGGKLLESVPGGNYLQSEGYQKLEQARRDFINAVLRRESGAVISEQEFKNAELQYFPRPGDKPETLKQKADNRRVALEGISRAAGQSYQPTPAKPAEPKPGSAEKGRDDFNASKAPVKVKTPEEAAKLAPGTVFETPDGRLKVVP